MAPPIYDGPRGVAFTTAAFTVVGGETRLVEAWETLFGYEQQQIRFHREL